MASEGIWLMSFLVYGFLLQVSKGQNAKYRTLNWNQNRYKQQTTSEPHLGAFDRVNTTDVPEEFEPVTDSSGIVINKPVPGQEMFNDVLNPVQATIDRENVSDTSLPQAITRTTTEPRLGTFDSVSTTDVRKELEPGISSTGVIINQTVSVQEMQNDTLQSENGNTSRLIKQGVSKVVQAESRVKPQSMIVMRTHALAMKGKGSKGQVQLYSVMRRNKGNDLTKAINSRKRGELKGYVVTDGRNVIKKQKPAKETQNQITIESQLGNLDRTNSTDAPEKFEPITNNQPQNRTTSESQLGISDRINTTDVPEEFEPVTNYKGVIINKSVQGLELYNDILTPDPLNSTLHDDVMRYHIWSARCNITNWDSCNDHCQVQYPRVEGNVYRSKKKSVQMKIERITIIMDKINDMSLPQTRMTIKPHQQAFDKTKAPDIPKEFKPGTRTRGGITNQPESGQEMQNYTLKSGNGNMSRWIKQGVGQVQETEIRVKPHNMVVGILNAFKGKNSKDQVQLYSVIGNNQVNDSIKARNSRKRSEYKSKDKDSGRKLKKSK